MSPSLKCIRGRLLWASLLALLLAAGYFVVAKWIYASSDDQCFWKQEGKRVLIQEVLPEGQAEKALLLEGDELVAIQGRRVNPRDLQASQRQINEQPEGRVLLYTVRREGRLLSLPLRLVKPFDWTGLSLLVTGLAAWGLGLLVVVSSPQRKISRHFFYLGVLTLLVPLGTQSTVVGNVPAPFMVLFLLVGNLALALAGPLWLHFFLRFPYPFPLRRNRPFLSALYGFFLLFGSLATLVRVAAFLSQDLFLGDLLLRDASLVVVRATDLMGGLAAAAGIGLFWAGTLKLPSKRRRALFPALVFSTAILVDLVAYTLLSRAAQGTSLVFHRQSWVFFSPLPLLTLAFAYAILRHGLFDVRRAILRWVTYFVVLGLTVALYLGAVVWAVVQGLQMLPAVWTGVLIGLGALPMGWLLRALLLFLRRKFRRDLASARDLLLGSLRESRKRLSVPAMLQGLEHCLKEAFRPQLLLVLPVKDRSIQLPPVKETEDGEVDEAFARPRRLTIPMNLLRHARENHELVLGLGSDEADWIREQGGELRAHVDALEAQVMVLILVNEEPHTVLLLGGKYAELNYGRDDRELLREVSQAAGILLETALLHQRIMDQGRIEQEFQTARRIQEGLITSEAPVIPGYQMALRLDPALETGGDLLWVKRRPQGAWVAAVGDVSGKGLAAALYMSQATALLKFASQDGLLDLERLLPALDTTMRNLMGPRDFLTLSLLAWDEGGAFRLARAGHPPAFLVHGSQPGDVEELCPRGRGLGLRPQGAGGWEVLEGVLGPREWLVMYSDGLTEAISRKGELYGPERLKEQLLHYWPTGSVRAACEAVFRDVSAFNAQNRDDRTLFILGREGA